MGLLMRPVALLIYCTTASLFFLTSSSAAAIAGGTPDCSEEWGYVQVRPKAHMFWWLYRSPQRVNNKGSTPWPTVLWLQGGPGASGVGYGNFMEIGPLDTNLKPRPSTWLSKADLLFVDNPVGTGFSYVEGGDRTLLARTDAEAATDLTTLLSQLYRSNNTRLQGSPLYIVAESYGGVALGNSWISPEDSVLSWGPLLYQVSRLDENGLYLSDSLAQQIKAQVKAAQFLEAENTWQSLESIILEQANYIDFYNFLKDDSSSDANLEQQQRQRLLASLGQSRRRYSSYLSSKVTTEGGFEGIMNTVIRDKLRIIPKNVTWSEQSDDVFEALAGDFMKPRILEVDELLNLGLNVTIYSGQLDLICATKGTLDWIQKLKWDGLKNFTNSRRVPLYCSGGEAAGTQAFLKSYKNLKFYWILGAGHMVPIDNPCPALKMLGDITQSPAQ
ncbi:serine carboxypeptidase-like 51 isoform X2 [Oryza glaberrima]|uniref:serine carboxypeptidase-like 51 isoform X2 n=1 Tax=Oryza glaberrima TaxID=4538 RepID=UPI00224C003A|nr:serine carboxypeptidase-like 51 isoform X2 [Oryza glaberrima]